MLKLYKFAIEMLKQVFIILIALLASSLSQAQLKDTVSVMHYNILHYGNYFSGCTTSNNNVADKDGYLKTIIDKIQPDIFTVNEMACNNVYARRIVQNSLNQSGRDFYEQAVFSNNTSSDICNMLFYNKNKIGLISQDYIDKGLNNSSLTRQIDVYHLYYKDPFLATHQDTVKLSVFVCHLNAGIASERNRETEAISNYLQTNGMTKNVILGGDLNIDGSSSQAYQNLTSSSKAEYALLDPINKPGSWSSNASFSQYHTQSTHTSGGCAAGGGMDDRFDFILMSNDLRDDSSGIQYVDNSYKAIAQDGQRFNGSILSPLNSSYNSNVIQALYDMSDHLPVYMELAFDQRDLTSAENKIPELTYRINGSRILLRGLGAKSRVSFYDLQGRMISQIETHQTKAEIVIPENSGILLCKVENEFQKPAFIKVYSH